MKNIKNILQMSLLIVLTQITLVLLTTPLSKSLTFQQSVLYFCSFCFFVDYFIFVIFPEN